MISTFETKERGFALCCTVLIKKGKIVQKNMSHIVLLQRSIIILLWKYFLHSTFLERFQKFLFYSFHFQNYTFLEVFSNIVNVASTNHSWVCRLAQRDNPKKESTVGEI